MYIEILKIQKKTAQTYLYTRIHNNTFLKTTYFDEDTQCTELVNDH